MLSLTFLNSESSTCKMEQNTIEFKPSNAKLPIKQKEVCRHLSIEVDESERDIRCKKCNARIEPFDYIWQMAIKERNTLYYIADLEKKQKEELAKLEDLERKIRNARATLNRINK